ncbi:F-box/kelch-repeat protein At3g23880-like [Apium graveolens]|uniref:F-box/kelch-repeat protein At3g23880-like n=1 Tax=Apium graveolens TaxID=4045 RepID=UPI003D797462
MAEMGKRNDGVERLTDEDLLSEVLCRLPVKYILQCKVVSKTWYSLISSPSFVKFHHRRAIACTNAGNDKEATLIVKLNEDDSGEFPEEDGSYSLFQLGGGCDEFLAHLKFPFSRGDYPSTPNSHFVGCVSGVVCIYVWNKSVDHIYIWNPATKQSKLIPSPPQYANPPRDRHGYGTEIKYALGFGFDSIDFDFKIVRVVSPRRKVSPSIFSEVYSAKRDAWRNIETEVTDFPDHNKFHICLHGFLFATGDNGVMAFNLNKEVFVCDVKLPISCYCGSICYVAQIAEFKDSVSVIISKCEKLGKTISLWTLDDEACLHGGGVKALWTFKLSIDVESEICHLEWVQGLYNSVEFLLLDVDGWFSYNSDNKVGRYIRPDPYFSYDEVFKYRESLLSVPGSNLVDSVIFLMMKMLGSEIALIQKMMMKKHCLILKTVRRATLMKKAA